MLFNSFEFAIFFPIVFVLYWLTAAHKTPRNVLLLLASYLFYGWWDWRFLLLIMISSLVDFWVGQKLYNAKEERKRKQYLGISLLVNLGFLVYFKYANFFIETFVDTFRLFGSEFDVARLNVILPVGISFYTFQTLSYTIDIYRKKIAPTKDWLAFFTFVAFFPQLVAGPIERASHLLPQFFRTHKFEYKIVRSGLLLIAFGLFKKMVIADRAAVVVNNVFNNVHDHAGVDYTIATVLFAFQIYCDFSGYSDIAIGTARTMGFDLMKNFNAPYFSKSITEFWRRWHISLSTWFRDYVYIPLGGSRKGKQRTYFNLFAVFLISGLWHGAAMTFIIWGAVHGLLIVLEKASGTVRSTLLPKLGFHKQTTSNSLFFTLLTFLAVCFAWIFFRANSLADAMHIINGLGYNNYALLFDPALAMGLGITAVDLKVLFLFIIVLLTYEVYDLKFGFMSFFNKQSTMFRWSAYVVLLLILVVFGMYGSGQPPEFIYFQF